MNSRHVGRFIDKLMRVSRGKEVWVILGSYRPHRSIAAEYERTETWPRENPARFRTSQQEFRDMGRTHL
jgi:hypothetical protein